MDILDSISPTHNIFQVVNLSQWRIVDRQKLIIDRSKLLMTYSSVVILVSAVILIYGLFNDTDINKTSQNEIGEMVDFIQMVGIRIAHLVCISEALFRSKEEMKFYTAVREIDQIFLRSLNVDIGNRHFRKRNLQHGVLMLIVYIGSESFILATKLSLTNQKFSIFWILYMFPFLICGLRYFQIFSAILLIKRRFDKLTKILEDINLQGSSAIIENDSAINIKFISKELPIFDSVDRIQRRLDMETPEMKRLLTIRDIYNRLWELNGIVNGCFGVSMLISIANDFISITSNCYWIFINFKEYSSTLMDFLQIAASAVWSVPHLLNVLALAIICEKTIKSTTNIALGLHSIKIDLLNDNHNTLIEQFSMQLLHQKLAFTAAGFFDVDCTLLYTIVGATTTYLIILIQFHMSEQKSSPTG